MACEEAASAAGGGAGAVVGSRGNEGCDDPLYYIARGDEHARLGALEEAEQCLTAALVLDPNLPMAHNNLGWVRQARGDRNGALAAYRRALALNASLRIAQINLATLLADMGCAEDALAIWRTLVAAHPTDRALLDRAISVHLDAGDLAESAATAEKYASLCRGNEWLAGGIVRGPTGDRGLPAPPLRRGLLVHDMEQFGYLRERGLLPRELWDVPERYGKVLERAAAHGDDAVGEWTEKDRELIGHVYGRIVHRPSIPRVAKALSAAWEPQRVEDMYCDSEHGSRWSTIFCPMTHWRAFGSSVSNRRCGLLVATLMVASEPCFATGLTVRCSCS